MGRILTMKETGFSLAAIGEILTVRDAAQEADKVTVLRMATEHLKERAETLRQDLERDIALCERRLRELGG